MRTPIARGLNLESNRFDIEPEITAKLLRRKVRLYETPIAYYGRSYDEGKKISRRDALPAVWTLLRFRFDESD